MEHDTSKNKQVWAHRRWVRERYGIPVRVLDRAITDGHIRTVKFGENRQSSRLIYVADVEKFMLALAAGKLPRRFLP